jgi:uroporphyrinogen-III decarboxylase
MWGFLDVSLMTTPFVPAETDHFRRLFAKRLEKVKAKTADVFAFRKVAQPPFIVNAAPYWAFGLDPESFPERYYDDPAVMTQFQERNYYEQVLAVDDDFVPYLMPWFGTAVTASALGCQVDFLVKMDPAVNPGVYPVQSPTDVKRLQIPNFERDGLMPRVLEFIRYMRANSFLPVGITDFQGPLTTANQLMGYDKLIYLMQDHPSAMHELMDKVTETLIGWVKKQKHLIGEALTECISDQQVYTGRHAGVWFSDDDAVLMSPGTYKEFVVPYNSRILKAFGGGCLHYCGNATHQAGNFLATEGLLAINNYALHDLRGFRELKSKLEDRIVLFVCDFTPLDHSAYYHELLEGLSLSGLVIDSQFTPAVALIPGGKYEAVRRDPLVGRKKVFDYLQGYFESKRAA